MLIALLIAVFVGTTAGLAWFLIAHDPGEKEPVRALWEAFGMGIVGAVGAGLLEVYLIPVSSLTPGASPATLLPATLAVAAIEETCKFLPLALLFYGRRYFNEYTDGVIYFALAGLGFGLLENVLYTLEFGAAAGIARIALTAFLHASITGIVGFYLARCKLSGRSPLEAGWALVGAIILHGFYDFGMLSERPAYILGSFIITFGATFGLLLTYDAAARLDGA